MRFSNSIVVADLGPGIDGSDLPGFELEPRSLRFVFVSLFLALVVGGGGGLTFRIGGGGGRLASS
jgi:hypothetical protein